MNLLCTSDLHGVIPTQMKEIINSKKIDAIIYAGDLSPHGWYGEGENVEELIEFLLSLGKPIYIVNGNVDPDPDFFEALEKINENFHYVHLKKLKLGEYYIVGLGSYFMLNQYVMDKFESLVRENPEKTIIVSHHPPKGLVDLADDGEHAGWTKLREIIEKYQPLLFVCGHIHEAAGVAKLGRTTVLNAAMKNVLVEIEGEEVNVSLV